MNPHQWTQSQKNGGTTESDGDQMTTAIVYRDVVLDVLNHVTEHFVDELGEEDGLVALRKLKELWVKKVQVSRVCEPPPRPPPRPPSILLPNYYAPPLRGMVRGQGWGMAATRTGAPSHPQFHQPSVVAGSNLTVNAPSRLYHVLPPPNSGQRLTSMRPSASHCMVAAEGAVEKASEKRDCEAPSTVSEEVPPPRMNVPCVFAPSDHGAVIPPPPTRRIRILRPKMMKPQASEPASSARPSLPQLDGAFTMKWSGVGMDDPSSSSDDEEGPFAGWDEFTVECEARHENSLNPGQEAKGEDLDELTSADDEIVRAQGEDETQRECMALSEKFAEVLLGKARNVSQRNGVWKINFGEVILRIKGRELLYRECEGSAKF